MQHSQQGPHVQEGQNLDLVALQRTRSPAATEAKAEDGVGMTCPMKRARLCAARMDSRMGSGQDQQREGGLFAASDSQVLPGTCPTEHTQRFRVQLRQSNQPQAAPVGCAKSSSSALGALGTEKA